MLIIVSLFVSIPASEILALFTVPSSSDSEVTESPLVPGDPYVRLPPKGTELAPDKLAEEDKEGVEGPPPLDAGVGGRSLDWVEALMVSAIIELDSSRGPDRRRGSCCLAPLAWSGLIRRHSLPGSWTSNMRPCDSSSNLVLLFTPV